ncbi:MAG: glycosyltransferase family 2 protein, partial [Deltaproteobacteria bacterium]|nr:glycosyltransferase family 2 protein [Deltaproteobacteria bacterium]
MPERVATVCALLIARDSASTIADRVRHYDGPADRVIVVDDGSLDDTEAEAQAAGARVLRLPSSRGTGVALRAGLRFARELGYIGALVPGADDLSPESIARLCVAHMRAPEALLVGVGTGEALA